VETIKGWERGDPLETMQGQTEGKGAEPDALSLHPCGKKGGKRGFDRLPQSNLGQEDLKQEHEGNTSQRDQDRKTPEEGGGKKAEEESDKVLSNLFKS